MYILVLDVVVQQSHVWMFVMTLLSIGCDHVGKENRRSRVECQSHFSLLHRCPRGVHTRTTSQAAMGEKGGKRCVCVGGGGGMPY